MKLHAFPIAIIIALAAIFGVGGVIGFASHGVKVTPNAIYAGESAYSVALTAADAYRHACVGEANTPAVLPVSCKVTLKAIQDAVKVTDAAYQKIKGYENNPPTTIGGDFLAAIDVLKGVIPGGF
jgi:hypothetical protein